MHEYDDDYQRSRTITSAHFAPAINAMNRLNKPLIVGETGITAGDGCWASRQQRADADRQKLGAYLGGGSAGVFVWNWFPQAPSGCALSFGPGDPVLAVVHDFPL